MRFFKIISLNSVHFIESVNSLCAFGTFEKLNAETRNSAEENYLGFFKEI